LVTSDICLVLETFAEWLQEGLLLMLGKEQKYMSHLNAGHLAAE
jgi:hypothetical protein